MTHHDYGMHTQAIHAGGELEPRDVAPPIRMASTYLFESAEEAARAFETETQPIYTRWGNPTIQIMEQKIAALEGGEAAVATTSGMAAVSAALLSVVAQGDHIVATTGLYSGTYHLLMEDFPRYGIETTLVDATRPAAFEAALRPNTRVLYLESPGNPTLALNDIEALAALGQEHDLITMIDNTFATPYNQQPLQMGIDVVLHSATKFLGGHGDALGGAVVGTQAFVRGVLAGPVRKFGGCISPFNAWLIARGIQTFPLRMARHNANALAIADWLGTHPKIAWVRYPWHPDHPQHDLARRQMQGGGGVVVFELKGGLEAGARLMDRVQLCARTVSLGDVRTLITHPASTTHHSVPRAARLEAGITDGLVRFAVGLEDVEDILADLDQALTK
jgi:cystathionine beta-lyase/cystathionine gamma-synthase